MLNELIENQKNMSKNNRWPFIISNPHCGQLVPDIVKPISKLSINQIIKDGDEQAFAIYSPLSAHCQYYIEATAARAYVDLNRRIDDFSKDGVVKTHTCWDESIYHRPLTANISQALLESYYTTYHKKLMEAASSNQYTWLFDCHTMAEFGPPVSPDSGHKRPLVCLGNANGQSCSAEAFSQIVAIFNEVFDGQVSENKPFSGGYICRQYGQYLPTIQIELSRTMDMTVTEKAIRIQRAFDQIALL